MRAVARCSYTPTEKHWKALLKVIPYLLGSNYLCLTFERGSGLDMSLKTDSNEDKNADAQWSVSGIAVALRLRSLFKRD